MWKSTWAGLDHVDDPASNADWWNYLCCCCCDLHVKNKSHNIIEILLACESFNQVRYITPFHNAFSHGALFLLIVSEVLTLRILICSLITISWTLIKLTLIIKERHEQKIIDFPLVIAEWCNLHCIKLKPPAQHIYFNTQLYSIATKVGTRSNNICYQALWGFFEIKSSWPDKFV